MFYLLTQTCDLSVSILVLCIDIGEIYVNTCVLYTNTMLMQVFYLLVLDCYDSTQKFSMLKNFYVFTWVFNVLTHVFCLLAQQFFMLIQLLYLLA